LENLFGNVSFAANADPEGPYFQPVESIAQFVQLRVALERKNCIDIVYRKPTITKEFF
jgi:hypothetical protein